MPHLLLVSLELRRPVRTSFTDRRKLNSVPGIIVVCRYYPSNMVHTRCCDQPICTECFIQIKRADPTPTHLESEPAACPFCMETNFGCVYEKVKLLLSGIARDLSEY